MPTRRVYLATHRASSYQRVHFAIFVPNEHCNRPTLAQDYRTINPTGTIIHVVGEPLMAGYTHQFKRNFVVTDQSDLTQLLLLGSVDADHLCDADSTSCVIESTARGHLEREAVSVAAPPRGQNVRAPVDGVSAEL